MPDVALGYHLDDMWPVFDAQVEREYDQWNHTRHILYYVARFGNSKSEGFPQSVPEFYPLPGDPVPESNIGKAKAKRRANMEKFPHLYASESSAGVPQ